MMNTPERRGKMSIVKQKYLKDENGEVFSPIVSNTSIYNSVGENLDTQLQKLQEQTILFDDGYYMNASQTIYVPISEQKHGIMLLFSAYSNGEPRNWNNANFVVLKEEAALLDGGWRVFPMGGTHGIDAVKYIYIYSNRLEGNDANQEGNAKNYVLRRIIGF